MKRSAALARRTPLDRGGALKRGSNRLPCGSLRVHLAHTWTGQSTGLAYRCPGVKARKALPRVRMATSRPAPAVPPSVRKALRERSGGFCEMRLEGCLGRATDPCHRIASGSGGRRGAAKVHHNRLSNVVHGCRACHDWCHRNVAKAEALGLMLREGDQPESAQVYLPAAGWVLLTNAGGSRLVQEVA